MKLVRTFAALVCLFGAACVVTAALLLITLGQTYELMVMSGGVMSGGESHFRRGIYSAAAALAVLGLPSLVAGVGLLTTRGWARRAWPFLTAFVLLAHALWFVSDLIRWGFGVSDLLAQAVIALPYLVPFFLLRRPAIKSLFRDRTA